MELCFAMVYSLCQFGAVIFLCENCLGGNLQAWNCF